MAKRTITQRIGLEGGEQIRSQLEAIGAAGQAAFKKFTDASAANSTLARFGATLEAVKAQAAAVGVAARKVGDDFNTLGTQIQGSAKRMAIVSAVIVGVAVGFVSLVKGAGEAADALRETAESVGLTTTELSNLQFAAKQSSISGDQLVKALLKVNSAIDDQGQKNDEFAKKQRAVGKEFNSGKINSIEYSKRLSALNEEAAESTSVFSRLGVATQGANGELRNSQEVLLDVADVFKSMPDGARKSALNLELFGKGSSKMVPYLNQGSDAILRLGQEAQRVAPGFGKLQQAVSDKLGDAIDTMRSAADSARNSAALLFAPAVTKLAQGFTEAIVANRSRLIEFAGTLAAKVNPVVDDFIALLEGRESDIQGSFILQARDAVVEFGKQTKAAIDGIIIPALKGLKAILDVTAEAINGIFGTNISGTQIAIALVVTKLIGLFGVLRGSIGLVLSVVRLLAVAFGGVALALATVGFAVGFFIVKSVGGLKGLQKAWDTTWNFITGLVTGALNTITGAATAVGNFFASIWNGTISAVQRAASAIVTFFANAWNTVTAGASALVAAVVAFFGGIPAAIATGFAGLVSLLQTVWATIIEGVASVGSGIVAAFSGAIEAIVAAFTGLPAALGAVFTFLAQLAGATWDAIVAKAVEIAGGIVNALRSALDSVAGFFSGLLTKILGVFASIVEAATKVGTAIKSAMTGAKAPGAATGGAVSAAGGGAIRGPGTSTSDSIRAWLSDGEYVHRAKAVQKYGVPFMNAINQGRLSLEAVRNVMGRGFNMGGLAESLSGSLMPRHMAMGGLAVARVNGGGGNMQPVNLHMGGEVFPTQASPDTIAAMQRYASAKQLRSAGRKPSWFGG